MKKGSLLDGVKKGSLLDGVTPKNGAKIVADPNAPKKTLDGKIVGEGEYTGTYGRKPKSEQTPQEQEAPRKSSGHVQRKEHQNSYGGAFGNKRDKQDNFRRDREERGGRRGDYQSFGRVIGL